MKVLALALLALFVAPPARAIDAAEREAILLHGPWPPEATADPRDRKRVV